MPSNLEKRLPEILNPAQLEAVTHPEGPLLVVAGAGTGKTRVITYRVAWLVERGVPPWRIMAVTFTNKAAREMRERIRSEVGEYDIWVSTFHSTAARLLRSEAERLGYGGDFTIYDDDDSRALVRALLKEEQGERRREGLTPGYVRSSISRAKNEMKTPGDIFPENPSDLVVRRVFERYEQVLRERNAMDFDDLLLNLLRLFEQFEDVREKYASRFLHLLVDEFQDTNLPQYRIVKHLASVHGNVVAAGDPDQSIYSWRGARLRNILEFQNDFPGCKVVRLEENYRSRPQIILAADTLIRNNSLRLERALRPTLQVPGRIRVARFRDEREEASGVVEYIKGTVVEGERSYSDFAVLMRTNAQSQVFEVECLKNEVPYVVLGGTAFFQRREVKDVIAYLRLVVNPRDDGALERAVSVPSRGVGTKTLQVLKKRAASRGCGLLQAMDEEFIASTPATARKNLPAFVSLFKRLVSMPLSPVRPVVEAVLEGSGYLALLKERSENERLENLEELLNTAARYDEENPGGDLRGFLEMVSLLTDQDRLPEERSRGCVRLMTLHAAKGLEFPVVFLVGMVEDKLPHARAWQESGEEGLEEERRLCYVGMTRAKEELHLSYYSNRTMGGKSGRCLRSRFLDELPRDGIEEEDLAPEELSWSDPPRSWGDDGFQAGRVGAGGGNGFPPLPEEPLRVYEAEFSAERGFRPGDRVLHKVFGVGTVSEVRGDRLTVVFVRVGRKRLSARFAGLERLG